MFGFLKRRRLAREAAAEAERQRLLAVLDRKNRIIGRQTGQAVTFSAVPAQYASRGDDSLGISSPLHPLSPFGVASQVAAFSSGSDPEPVRSHCAPAASDDSSSRSSSSDSCSSGSWGGSDSSSSSSYDSGSSSSSSYDSSSSY